jgi:hypothetical protein
MRDDKLTKLTIFEAILFGIYGNWLISFVDKLTFPNTNILTSLEVGFVSVSFVSLFLLISWSIFQPQKLTRFWTIVLGLTHFGLNVGALIIVGSAMQYTFFLFIGAVMFLIICQVQYQRSDLVKHSNFD